ncbi:hypothetical protein, partial [Caballeronia sp. INML3]|uniref:hypothetical protein n=1 Tax=Caballeronia sp. INML3 TaxID=2921752 RepID=UPI0039062D4B
MLLAHAVETGQQGCSANRAMLNFVCRYVGAQGYMQLAIDVPEAAVGLLDTYRRCGFKYVDAFFREGEVLERIVLSRPIMT